MSHISTQFALPAPRVRATVIVLNLFWAICALIYDFPILRTLPPVAIPFIIICPLYPALLAYAWHRPQGPTSLLSLAILFRSPMDYLPCFSIRCGCLKIISIGTPSYKYSGF